jgi:hypothetical protein
MIRELVGTKSANFKDGILQTTRRNAESMVRTATQHVSSAAQHQVWTDNRNVVAMYKFVATLDFVTSKICRTLDGQEFDFGKGPIPPVHMNCLLPDTLITSSMGIAHIFKRAYKGEVVTINTRSGNVLTVTPNHPILTDRGWSGAKFLNIGDKCFIDSSTKGVVAPKRENDTVYATIEQITESFLTSFDVLTMEVPAAAPDFHGDSINDEITNVFSFNGLGFVSYSPNIKHGGKGGFIMGDAESAVFSTGDGSFVDRLRADNSTSCGGVGFFDQLLPVGEAGSIHPSLLLSGYPSNLDTMLSQDSIDGAWTDSEFLADTACADAFGVELDDVISVKVSDFSGHVYNLETHDHLVKCNGVVTHNCRSRTIPILDEKYRWLSKGRTRSAVGGPVSSQTSYYDWLKRQDDETVKDVLGRDRAKLFLDGGLTNEQFRKLQFDKSFMPLTLKGMKSKQPEAFKKAGL